MFLCSSSRKRAYDFPRRRPHILQDHITAGDQDQGDARGEEHAEPEADGHGDEELGLEALFDDHGAQPREGRE